MCVAFIVPTGVEFPTLEDLRDMEESNPDGAGIAWVKDQQVHWLKGLDARELWSVGSQVDGPRVAHFRLATAGGRGMGLSHPFPVEKTPRTSLSGSGRTVLVHNGHISEWKLYARLVGPLPDQAGGWSDTRLAARLAAMHGHEILKEFADQKFAMLDRGGKIKVWGNWDERSGVYYSNLHWSWFTRRGSYEVCDRDEWSYPTRAGQGVGKPLRTDVPKELAEDYAKYGDPDEIGWREHLANKYGPQNVTKSHAGEKYRTKQLKAAPDTQLGGWACTGNSED